jgi:hypothetical protein
MPKLYHAHCTSFWISVLMNFWLNSLFVGSLFRTLCWYVYEYYSTFPFSLHVGYLFELSIKPYAKCSSKLLYYGMLVRRNHNIISAVCCSAYDSDFKSRHVNKYVSHHWIEDDEIQSHSSSTFSFSLITYRSSIDYLRFWRHAMSFQKYSCVFGFLNTVQHDTQQWRHAK